MPESEEALLRRAAQRLRDDATRTSRGPWAAEQGSDEAPGIGVYDWWFVAEPDGTEITLTNGLSRSRQGDVEWMAMLGPQLAEPLAAWLDDAAHWCSGGGQSIHSRSPTGRAVAVARALLGEPALTDPVRDDRQEEK